MKSTISEVPNGILFVFDPTNRGVSVPAYVDGSLIAANEACISVGTQAPPDGKVEVSLGGSGSDHFGLHHVFSGALKTPGRRVAVFTAQKKCLLEDTAFEAESRIQIWVDDFKEPGKVVVHFE